MAHPAPAPPAHAGSLPPVDGALATGAMEAGRSAGLDAVGLAPAGPFEATRVDLVERRERGLAAGMQFTYRNPARSTDPGRVVTGARVLVVGARAYPGPWATAGDPDPEPGGVMTGQVAAYARTDGYAPLRAALGAVAAVLRGAGWRAVVVCDDNALVDRAAAHRAGIGWYGRNALLFVPGLGSRVLLGSVVTDAPLLGAGPDGGSGGAATPRPHAEGCGRCTRCLSACPTGALVGPGEVDARRCLAWLVQAPGSFPVEHRVALGARIYGCDECQRVCPVNRVADRTADRTTDRALERAAGPGEGDPTDPTDPPRVDLLDLLAASDDELLARFGHWYVPRRDPTTIRRNALVALGNVADPADARVTAALRRVAGTGGTEDGELLAEHARWALARLAVRFGSTVGPTRA